jgi:hypothetical protein
MGHKVDRIESLFSDVCYRKKTSAELRTAMQRKVQEIKTLSQTREGRILKLREDYEIDAELLSRLVIQFHRNETSGSVNYNHQPGKSIIPAGVIANIIREQEMIDSERDQLRKLDLVIRNMRDTEFYFADDTGEHRERACIHELSDYELEYLGF